MSQLNLMDQAGANPEVAEARRILEAFEESEGPWLERIRVVALRIYRQHGRPISTDDLRFLMDAHPELEPPRESRNIMGAVFTRGFRRVGYRRSEYPGSHGNLIGTWVPLGVQ